MRLRVNIAITMGSTARISKRCAIVMAGEGTRMSVGGFDNPDDTSYSAGAIHFINGRPPTRSGIL